MAGLGGTAGSDSCILYYPFTPGIVRNLSEEGYKMIRTMVCLQVMILCASSAYAQGKCANPKLRWELRPGAITTGDASAVFDDGVNGVTGVMHRCSGSFDANLDTGKNRKISFAFTAANLVAGSVPTWATTGEGGIQIRNLRLLGESVQGSFTTWMSATPPSPKNTTHKFRMFNPDADYEGGPTDSASATALNDPYITSRVTVHHCPAGSTSAPCTGASTETWYVTPDPTPVKLASNGTDSTYANVGTLVDMTRLKWPVNLGQFQMPFSFVISLK